MKEGHPPTPVAIAAWLLAAYGVLSLFRIAAYGSGLPSSATSIAIWTLSIACFALIARLIYRGNNLARWLLAIAVAASLVWFPLFKPEIPHGSQLAIYVLQIALPVVASAMTFTPQAKAWFQT